MAKWFLTKIQKSVNGEGELFLTNNIRTTENPYAKKPQKTLNLNLKPYTIINLKQIIDLSTKCKTPRIKHRIDHFIKAIISSD